MKTLKDVKVFCPLCGCDFGKFKKILFNSSVDISDFEVLSGFNREVVIRGGSIFCPLCSYQFNINAMQFVITSHMYPELQQKFRERIKKELVGIKQKVLKEKP